MTMGLAIIIIICYNTAMKKTKSGFIYILFNKKNGTLYTGVTSDLYQRVNQHKQKVFHGFTEKYDVDKLGYYEFYENIDVAIDREKQIKAGSRQDKLDLIVGMNPEWKDLFYTVEW